MARRPGAPARQAPAQAPRGRSDRQLLRERVHGSPRFQEAAALLKAAGQASRLLLLASLRRSEELAFTDLCTASGLVPSKLTGALIPLRLHGLVRARWDGKTRFYRWQQHAVEPLLDDLLASLPSLAPERKP